jgi:hypothetical protein
MTEVTSWRASITNMDKVELSVCQKIYICIIPHVYNRQQNARIAAPKLSESAFFYRSTVIQQKDPGCQALLV